MSRQSERYYTGTYAVCRECGSRPCSCADPPAAATVAQPTSLPVPLHRPATGNAIPFAVWDTVIPRYSLSFAESSVLLYLCRRTIGYGHHEGDFISLRQIATALNMGHRTAQRALNTLQRHGLVERNRRYERNSREHGTTHIKVTLPA